MHRINWLHDQWKAHLNQLEIELSQATDVWELLLAAYQEPHRTYHNLTHIQALLQQQRQFEKELIDSQAVISAIWFHDLIYEPFRKDNEEKSAAQAGLILQTWNQPPSFISTVVQLIEDTAQHQPSNHSVDTLLFLDMDLSILGSAPEQYKAYCAAIREEYKQVPEEMYRVGRQEILKRFLERPHLYFSPTFQDRYEAQARENIAQELLLLKA